MICDLYISRLYISNRVVSILHDRESEGKDMRVVKTEYKEPNKLTGIMLCSGAALKCGGNASIL